MKKASSSYHNYEMKVGSYSNSILNFLRITFLIFLDKLIRFSDFFEKFTKFFALLDKFWYFFSSVIPIEESLLKKVEN